MNARNGAAGTEKVEGTEYFDILIWKSFGPVDRERATADSPHPPPKEGSSQHMIF